MVSVAIEQKRAFAQDCFNRGNLGAADVVCREVLDDAPADAASLRLLASIAATVGMRDHAARHLADALSADPTHAAAQAGLSALRASAPVVPSQATAPRYLVIKSWGFGFWSDVSQVLGALLLAEATGRVPLVHWGRNSLFGDGSARDAFRNYFEPVSNLTLEDVAKPPDASCFPPKWNRENLLEENLNKWRGAYSRGAALYFLSRPEQIAVFDFFAGVIDVAPWLATDHPMHGKPLIDSYRYLIQKYLKPRQPILDACESFFQARLAGAPFVAVHMRGSDKTLEDAELERTNQSILQALSSVEAGWKIFLLSDDENWVGRVKEAYGDRVVTTESRRAAGKTGVHYLKLDDPVRLGREVMTDVYVAARADKFFGNGRSNVAAFVQLLKNWNPGDCVLVSPSLLMGRNLFIHLAPDR